MRLSISTYQGRREIRAKVAYKYKDHAKKIHGYRWRANDKEWAYPATAVMAADLEKHFRSLGMSPQCDEDVRRLAKKGRRLKNGHQHPDTVVSSSQVPAWGHQTKAVRWMLARESGMLHMEMGTGKSKCVVDWAQSVVPSSLVVVAPKNAMGVWPREFDLHSVGGYEYHVTCLPDASIPDRIEAAKGVLARPGLSVVVLNYATTRKSSFRDLIRDNSVEAVVADESHRIKSPSSQQSKAFAWLHGRVRYRWALTGTPMPKGPEDLYAQFRFVDQGVFGRSFKKFKQNYCRTGGYKGKQIIGHKNKDEMAERLGWLQFQVGEEVLDLPEALEIDRYIPLHDRQYAELADIEGKFWRQVARMEGEVSTGWALKRMLKMQQATSGFIKPDPEKDDIERIPSQKEGVLADIIEDTNERVVVFCKFHADLDTVRQVVEEAGLDYGEISGRQKDLTDTAEMPPGVDVMGVQIKAGAEGIDLTAASVGVFYSLGFSLGNYRQAKRRLHRPGQERTVRFFRLIGKDSIDEKIVEAIEGKKSVVDHLVSLVNSHQNTEDDEQQHIFAD